MATGAEVTGDDVLASVISGTRKGPSAGLSGDWSAEPDQNQIQGCGRKIVITSFLELSGAEALQRDDGPEGQCE
jgi:hypothetical protein